MALQTIDFRTPGGDTGDRDLDSVEPIVNGESADQTAFRRPTEHVRARTELLRQLVRQRSLLSDADGGNPIVVGGGTVTPVTGGGGELTFTLGANLYVMPLVSAGGDASAPYLTSTQASLVVGTGVNEMTFTSQQKQFEGSTFPAADPNRISIELEDTGTLGITVEGATGDETHIHVTIDAGTTTIADVISQITGDATANALVSAAATGGADTNTAPTFSTAQWGSDYTARFLRGGLAGVAHLLSPSALASFFGTTANELQEGDTLAIRYDQVVNESSTGGRMQSTPDNGNIEIGAALFNTRVSPEYAPNCVPICKRTSANDLTFVNGATITLGTPATLQFDSASQAGAEGGSLATPLSWQRLTAGTHAPPTSIREALDNADYHVDLALDEVEAARSSTVFGAQASLDARIEAVDTHARAVVTCTDGTSSTGGLYNGTAALQTAITALGGLDGGTILLRAGTYEITTNLTTIRTLRIIGVESGVIISNRASSGYMLTFSGSTAAKSVVQNVSMTNGVGSSNDMLATVSSADDLRVAQSNIEGRVSLAAARARFEQCQLLASTGSVLIVTSSSSDTYVGQSTVQTTLSGSRAAYVSSSVTFEDCSFTAGNDIQAIATETLSSAHVVMRRCEVTANPFTAGAIVVSLVSGYGHTLDDVVFSLGGTGTISSALLYLGGTEFAARNLRFNLSDQVLDSTVLACTGAAGVVDGVSVINAGVVPNSTDHSTTLSWDAPYFDVTPTQTADSTPGLITVRNVNISGFSEGTTSADTNLVVFGATGSGGGGVAAASNGRIVAENITIDLSGLAETLSASAPDIDTAAFANIPAGSVFRNCAIELGSTGALRYGWRVVDADNVMIEGCRVTSSLANGTGYLITLEADDGQTCKACVVRGCVLRYNDGWAGLPAAVAFTKTGAGVVEHNVLTGCVIVNAGSTAAHDPVYISSGAEYNVVVGNSIDKGSSTEAIDDDSGGSTNLYLAATDSDPLNAVQ